MKTLCRPQSFQCQTAELCGAMDTRRWSMMDGGEPLTDQRPQLRPARGPVLQPLKRQSLQPLRQRLDSGGDVPNGTEKQPLQMWQILQEERESHQQTQAREKQLLLQVNQLKEDLDTLRKTGATTPLENGASQCANAELLQSSIERLQSQLAEERLLIETQRTEMASQNVILKQLKETINDQEMKHSFLQNNYTELQHVKSELSLNIERLEKKSQELQNKLILKENEAEEMRLNLKRIDVSNDASDELETERQKLKEIFDTLQTEIELKHDLKSEYERIVSNKDFLISQKDAEILSQRNQIQEQSDKLQCLKELLDSLTSEKDHLKHQLEENDKSMKYIAIEKENNSREMFDNKLQEKLDEKTQQYRNQLSEMEERYQKQQTIIAGQADELRKKDAELRIENTKLQFIEEKVNEFDIKLTNQIQELQDQITLNEQLQAEIEARDDEISFITEKMDEQRIELEDKNQKLVVLDMLEEELQEKNALILEKDQLLIGAESINADTSQLQSDAETLREEIVKTTQLLEEKDSQIETLQTFCRYQLQQHEEQLVLQYKLETRLHEQSLHLERNQIEKDELSKQLEVLETLQEDLRQKDLQILNKEYKLQILPGLQKKLEVQTLQLQENEQEVMKLNTLNDELKSKLQIADELKTVLNQRVQELEENAVMLGQKVEQLELDVSQRDAQIESHENELERSNRYSLELLRKQQVAADCTTKAEEEILDLKNQISENLVILEEKNQLFKTLNLQINEKDTEIENVRLSLVCLSQEKQELNEKIERLNKCIAEQGRDIDLQDESLQKQDRYIQRLQQSNLQLEQDLQIHQQDSLRQHQDLIEDYIQAKEILEQQLLKQNMLLQQQDLQLHQQDEKLQEINQKSKFYSWGTGKKK